MNILIWRMWWMTSNIYSLIRGCDSLIRGHDSLIRGRDSFNVHDAIIFKVCTHPTYVGIQRISWVTSSIFWHNCVMRIYGRDSGVYGRDSFNVYVDVTHSRYIIIQRVVTSTYQWVMSTYNWVMSSICVACYLEWWYTLNESRPHINESCPRIIESCPNTLESSLCAHINELCPYMHESCPHWNESPTLMSHVHTYKWAMSTHEASCRDWRDTL